MRSRAAYDLPGDRDVTPSASVDSAPRARDAALALALGALAVLVQLPIYDRWLPYFDEGFIYQIADEIRRGAVMYRDVAHVAFPGVFHLMAAVFALAGPSVWTGRVVAVALFAIATMLTFALARTMLSRGWAVVAAALFVVLRPWAFPQWHMVHYSTLAVTLIAAAAWATARALPVLRIRDVALTGALLGLAVLAKQDYGGAVAVGTAAFLILSGCAPGRFRALAALGLGAGVVLAPVAAWFAWQGALGDLVHQCIVAPLFVKQLWRAGGGEYISFFGFRPLLHQNPVLHSVQAFNYLPPLAIDLWFVPILTSWWFRDTIVVDTALKLVFALPVLLVLLETASLWRRRRARDARWWAEVWLATVAASLLLAFNKPRDWAHLVPVSYPIVVLLPLAWARAARAGGWRRALVLGPSAAIVATLLVVDVAMVRAFRARYDTAPRLPRAGVRLEASEARVLEDLQRWLSAHVPAEARVPVYPYHPSIEFVLGRDGVGRYRTIEPVAGGPERDAEVVAALAHANPPAVVVSFKELVSQPRFADYAAPIWSWLVDHDALGPVFSCAQHRCILGVLTPRAASGEDVAVDLVAATADAPVRVIDASGVAVVAPPSREELVGVARWSYFAPVLALRALPAGATVSVAIPAPAVPTRFRARVGIDPERWAEFEPGVTTIGLSLEEAGRTRPIWEIALDPESRYDDRPWRDVDVAVPAASGGTLLLWVKTDRPQGYPLMHAGLEAPRLVRAGG